MFKKAPESTEQPHICPNCGKKLTADGARQWPFADKICECPQAATVPEDEDRWKRTEGDHVADDWERIPSPATSVKMSSLELPVEVVNLADPGAIRWARPSLGLGAGSNLDGADDRGATDSHGLARLPDKSPSRIEPSRCGQESLKQTQMVADESAVSEDSWAWRPGFHTPPSAIDIVVSAASSADVTDADSQPVRPALKLVENVTEPTDSKSALSPEIDSAEVAKFTPAPESQSAVEKVKTSVRAAPLVVPKKEWLIIGGIAAAILAAGPLFSYVCDHFAIPFADTPNAWLNRLEKAWLEREALSRTYVDTPDADARLSLNEKRREASRVCNECIQHIVAMGPATVPLLVADLKSDQPMASISTTLLQKIGSPSVPPLVEALKNSVNPNPGVSGDFLTPDATYENVLITCGHSAQMAAAALCASSSERDRFVGAKLLNRFCVQSLFRRGAGLEFSRTIGPDEVRNVLIGLDQSKVPAVRCALITCLSAVEPGTPAVDAVLSRILLTSTDSAERVEAARSVGAIAKISSLHGCERSVNLLSQALAKDDDMYVRLACARSLSELPYVTPPAVAALRKAEHDPAQPVREGAFAALCKAAAIDKSCLADLTMALSDADDSIVRNALYAVGNLSQSAVAESPLMVAKIISMLRTAPESMRLNVIHALQSLGRIVPDQVAPEIVKALKSANPNERRQLVLSLDTMGESAVELALPELRKIADDPSDGAYGEANRILSRWKLTNAGSK